MGAQKHRENIRLKVFVTIEINFRSVNDNFIGGGEERAGWCWAFCVPESLFNFYTKKKLAQVGSHHECHWWQWGGGADYRAAL